MTFRYALFGTMVLFAGGCDQSHTWMSQGIANSRDELNTPKGVRQLRHDFGTLLAGDSLKHTFVIRNDSTRDWNIARVTTGCSCIVSNISSRRIASGSGNSIELCFSSGSDAADIQKRVSVEFFEEGAPVIELLLTGYVRRPLMAMPDRISVTGAIAGNPIHSTFAIQSFQNCDYGPPVISCNEKWLRTRLSENRMVVNPIRQSWNVAICADTTLLEPGTHATFLRIQLTKQNSGERQELSVPYRISVKGPVEVRPRSLFFGTIRADASGPITKHVLVDFEKKSIVSTSGVPEILTDLGDRCSVQWNWKDSRRAVLDVLIFPPSSKSEFGSSVSDGEIVRGTIIVRFEASQIPAIKIPLVAMFENTESRLASSRPVH